MAQIVADGVARFGWVAEQGDAVRGDVIAARHSEGVSLTDKLIPGWHWAHPVEGPEGQPTAIGTTLVL
ncbi:MAG: hypothetical protein U1C73_00745, partial [Dietzia sp.]|nr:hypothetical protein [Dietzia sp.]